jgi:metal-responsive CopG/Arc/MetJ family transcriptional regulator
MAGTAKVAISLDRDLFLEVERTRERTGETRSALMSRALQLLTREEQRAAQVRDYVRAYQEHPETKQEVTAARVLARRALKNLPWAGE